ncbi:uncharacterized protein LOC9637586 isoform X1 [Selaginella moellendorffii]|uniref:uncharacterized protein LOC9637586 isoform X1 n=1 Tax=Selaginella moellendorffii TaxID=88036 RepID=UPI000D1CBFE0|nr:uncharacterized protein LOC9637586 isoform X1 [Selaginella moellendorffii]|eukprot:XP_024517995.1 uncharacterized protein LOC9637586 isoform X1 [Selaginella moellendorffii]
MDLQLPDGIPHRIPKEESDETPDDVSSSCISSGNGSICHSFQRMSVPKTPWVSFVRVLKVLKEKLSFQDFIYLVEQYTVFKQGKISRNTLVRVFKDIVGEQTLKEMVISMQPEVLQAQKSLLRSVKSFAKHTRGMCDKCSLEPELETSSDTTKQSNLSIMLKTKKA